MKTHPNLIKNSYEIIDEQRKRVVVIFIIHFSVENRAGRDSGGHTAVISLDRQVSFTIL